MKSWKVNPYSCVCMFFSLIKKEICLTLLERCERVKFSGKFLGFGKARARLIFIAMHSLSIEPNPDPKIFKI